ncbi:hypothetical protein [Massilia sp. CF038]|uniref:hypothetical protein n=1 Tax=Massilia sp. CF038 TaxID=1881045 RepID=UPI00116118CC|nr:hypothetical protein [Massilia sp. CF038]
MNPCSFSGIKFHRSSLTEDEFELFVTACDGLSTFAVEMYATPRQLITHVEGLARILAMGGGIYDLQVGRFGPEFAGGAVQIRFHVRGDVLFLGIHMQARHFEFGRFSVAPEGKLYVKAGLSALKHFVEEFRGLVDASRETATLTSAAI